ncbi:MAG: hypothetical protein U5K31_01015 [Balneolaceae bacterium]|nr:hypothetical protein [Balneolaceae bacterium]
MSSSYRYEYHTDGQTVILFDRESGRAVSRENDRVLSLLRWLREGGRRKELRRWSVWCARRMSPSIKPVQRRLLRAAEAHLDGETGAERIASLYEETEGMAVATDTVGLRQGSAGAPAFLATRECVNPDAWQGALRCSQYLSLWKAARSGASPSFSTSLPRPDDQREVDFLLDLSSGFSI